jgi:hypothetical protein
LRGLDADAPNIAGRTWAETAEELARALREAASGAPENESPRLQAGTREYYETHFSLPAYERNLSALAGPLLAGLG